MKNIVAVSVDDKGNVQVDFSGYSGRACELEEGELRRRLSELGLRLEARQFRPKRVNPTTPADTRTALPGRIKV
jgi:hypothetical protein